MRARAGPGVHANRAHYQVVSDSRHDNGREFQMASSRFSWCGREIILPRVPGSPSSGAIIATRGLDAAVRGLNKFSSRVDVVGIDDPDTEETVNNPEQAVKLEKRIDMAIAGLGGQQWPAARVMLTTLHAGTAFRRSSPTHSKSHPGKKAAAFASSSNPPIESTFGKNILNCGNRTSRVRTDWPAVPPPMVSRPPGEHGSRRRSGQPEPV